MSDREGSASRSPSRSSGSPLGSDRMSDKGSPIIESLRESPGGSPVRTPPRSGTRSRSRSYRRNSRSRSRSLRRYSRSRSRSRGRRRYSRSRSRSRSPHGSRRSSRRSRQSPMSNRKRHKGNRDNPKESCCLGVFGLSLYTQERDLREIFSRFGPVDEVQVVYDHQTGRSRGFAFIYMRSSDDAAEAKDQAPGMEIDGRKIRVDYSITERAHTPTPGIYLGKPTVESRPSYRRSPSPYYYKRGRYSRSRSRSRSYSPRTKKEIIEVMKSET